MAGIKMSRSQVVAAVAARMSLRRPVVRSVIDHLLDEIERVLAADGEVRLAGFGTFLVRHRGARPARNLRSGERVVQPAQRVPAFRSSEVLRKRLSEGGDRRS